MLIPVSELLWGQPLERYANTYGILGAMRREIHGNNPRQLARAAVEKICYYAGSHEASLKPMDVVQKVSLEMLYAVFRMSHDPNTYDLFLSPGLASGCITLMAVKGDEKASPFRYEYGYLCFRILLFSLGASILTRLGDSHLKVVLKLMEDPRYANCAISDIFSAQTAQLLSERMFSATHEADCDWILGWESHLSHPRSAQIISRQKAKSLIDVLWEDRVDFLRAMRLTFTPVLAPLLFLNWRYACLENTSASANSDTFRRAREIHWRCLLVVTSNQDNPVRKITDCFCVSLRFHPGKRSTMFPKSQDSKEILEAYISRLTPTNLAMYDPLFAPTLPPLLDLVTPNFEISVEDLLPTLFGVTINRLWEVLRVDNCTYDDAILPIALTFEQIRVMFKLLREKYITRRTLALILEQLVQRSFLDLIASLFLSLDPDAEENTGKES
ncbi:unnamed protein product [Rhizoctonia solani]|uniref:Uncharacterized protein n=1 Tax=Rhizoctonia solani TaxID=456999 RepID=A0A8H3DUB0_9AGAM|nr:unnamed protein product [Rhizoctonia solani]